MVTWGMSCLLQGVKAICWSVHTAKYLEHGMCVTKRDLSVTHENGPSHSPMWGKWENLGCSTRLSSWAAWESYWERAALKIGGNMAQKRAGGTSGASGEFFLFVGKFLWGNLASLGDSMVNRENRSKTKVVGSERNLLKCLWSERERRNDCV